MPEFQLLMGDCLDLMPALAAGSADMVMCDLPYGTTQNKWDAVIPFAPLWAAYRRLCGGAIVLTASQPFTSALVMSRVDAFKYAWVWDKVNRPTGHLNAKKQPLRESEDVVVFYEAQPTYNPQMVQGAPYRATGSKKSANYGSQVKSTTICDDGLRYPRNIIAIPADERGTVGRIHPTQKPVALMEYLIRTYTNEGETVLDNTMGSGTTGVACMNTGRNFIGIERDPGYFEIARARIEAARNGL
jgi:site-specific DNA-methyltransferase (adenine-specific)